MEIIHLDAGQRRAAQPRPMYACRLGRVAALVNDARVVRLSNCCAQLRRAATRQQNAGPTYIHRHRAGNRNKKNRFGMLEPSTNRALTIHIYAIKANLDEIAKLYSLNNLATKYGFM